MDSLTRYEFSFKNPFVPLTTIKAIVIILLVGFIVYGNMLFNGFVWDDIGYIVLSPTIHSLQLPVLIGINDFNNGWFYRPTQPIYYASLFFLFKDNAFPYHFLQLIFHCLNASILYLFLPAFLTRIYLFFYLLFFLSTPYKSNPFHISSAQVMY